MHGFLAGIFSGNSLSDLNVRQGQCMKGGFNQRVLLMSRLPIEISIIIDRGLGMCSTCGHFKKLKKMKSGLYWWGKFFFIISFKTQNKK